MLLKWPRTDQSKTKTCHWGRVAHICVSKLTIIGSDNGLSPGRRQAIVWTNARILLIRPPKGRINNILALVQIKLPWNCNRNSNVFIQENALENVVCEMASISSRPQCVKWGCTVDHRLRSVRLCASNIACTPPQSVIDKDMALCKERSWWWHGIETLSESLTCEETITPKYLTAPRAGNAKIWCPVLLSDLFLKKKQKTKKQSKYRWCETFWL